MISFPSSDPLFFKLEIVKIQDIFKHKMTKFIYKCLNENTPINFHHWFVLTTQVHNYNTRSKYINGDQTIHTKNLFIPNARTSHYGLKKIKVHGPKIWNSLPPSIRIKPTLGQFNTEIKKYLLKNYVQSNE